MAYHETRSYKAGFPITSRRFEQFGFHAHWHYELELMLVLKGSIHASINSATRLLHAGDISVCACEDIHYYEGSSPDGEVLIVVFHPDVLGEAVELNLRANAFASFLDPASIAALGIPEERMADMRACLLTIHEEMEAQGRDYEMFVKAAVLKLMALLSRHASAGVAGVPAGELAAFVAASGSAAGAAAGVASGATSGTRSGAASGAAAGAAASSGAAAAGASTDGKSPAGASSGVSSHELVDTAGMKLAKKALRYIELNYAQDITLDQISEHLSISPFYFSRVFSQVTGLTFKNYLNTIKVEKAQNLIRTTAKPILDIAYDCGFNSIRTFNRVFLNIKGYTPTSLR